MVAMRNLTDHIVEGDSANHQLTITVTDEPGQGGANHKYEIAWPAHPSEGFLHEHGCHISFQNGPIKEFGVNGVTQEALLAIVIDRLRSFQAGPFATGANHNALADCLSALNWLQQHTRDRIKRGVEGSHAA